MWRWLLQSPKQHDYRKVAKREKQKVRECDVAASSETDNGGDDDVRNGEVVVHGVSEAAIENRHGKDKQIEDDRQRKPSPTPKGAFPCRLGLGGAYAFVHGRRIATPNDSEISYCGGWREPCAASGKVVVGSMARDSRSS